MNEVKWIKLEVGMFDGMSFKKIKRAKIGGESFRDKLTAVWFELMDFAGKCNNDGALSRHKEMPCENDEIPYTELEDIATMIDRDEEELKLCMSFFIKEGMVSIIDDVYSLSNWSKYQNEEGLNKIKEQNRLRKQKQRKREKELLPAECHAEQRDMSRDTSRDVTLQNKNIERDIDIEIDKEIDKEKNIKKESSELKPQTDISTPYKDAFAEFSGENKELLKAFRNFEKMRKKLRKPLSDEAKKRLVKKLKSLSENPDIQIKILNQSEDNCWLSVFALKQDAKPLKREYSSAELDFIKKLDEKYSV